MAPGVAFLYSGLLRRKNALSMLLLGLAVYSVATIQWFFWGYTLAFSTSGPFIGNLSKFGFMGVLDAPSVGSLKVPELREFPLSRLPTLKADWILAQCTPSTRACLLESRPSSSSEEWPRGLESSPSVRSFRSFR